MESFMNALMEMATICPKKLGYGFILRIYSEDHEPAHVHMLDLEGNEITKILLTREIPKNIDDIKEVSEKSTLNNHQKKNFLKWAKEKSKLGVNNWLRAIDIWDMYQDDKIDG